MFNSVDLQLMLIKCQLYWKWKTEKIHFPINPHKFYNNIQQ